MYWRKCDPRYFGYKHDSGDDGEHPREARLETHLDEHEGPKQSIELSVRELGAHMGLLCVGLQR
jgi:hypothetical protein